MAGLSFLDTIDNLLLPKHPSLCYYTCTVEAYVARCWGGHVEFKLTPQQFVTGSLETDDRLCRSVARSLRIAVISIDYSLAPEYKFPAGFEDCLEVVEWVRKSHPHAQNKNTH